MVLRYHKCNAKTNNSNTIGFSRPALLAATMMFEFLTALFPFVGFWCFFAVRSFAGAKHICCLGPERWAQFGMLYRRGDRPPLGHLLSHTSSALPTVASQPAKGKSGFTPSLHLRTPNTSGYWTVQNRFVPGGGSIKHFFSLGCSRSGPEHTQIFCPNQSSNINKNKHTHTISARTRAQPGTTKETTVCQFFRLFHILFQFFSHLKSLVTNGFRATQWNIVALDIKMFCLVLKREGKHVIRYWWGRHC